jgi:hypothetical protein
MKVFFHNLNLSGSEALPAVTMKCTVFCLRLASCWFLAWLTLRPLSWKQHLGLFSELHDVTTQKTIPSKYDLSDMLSNRKSVLCISRRVKVFLTIGLLNVHYNNLTVLLRKLAQLYGFGLVFGRWPVRVRPRCRLSRDTFRGFLGSSRHVRIMPQIMPRLILSSSFPHYSRITLPLYTVLDFDSVDKLKLTRRIIVHY